MAKSILCSYGGRCRYGMRCIQGRDGCTCTGKGPEQGQEITRNQARCLIYNTGGLDNVTECEVAECDAADESGCELDRVS